MKKLVLLLLGFSAVVFAVKKTENQITARQHIFLLSDNDDSKFYLNDSVKVNYEKGIIINSPAIVINGVKIEYKTDKDTVYLPLKKTDIGNLAFLHNESSSLIYGKKETNGAIIINIINSK